MKFGLFTFIVLLQFAFYSNAGAQPNYGSRTGFSTADFQFRGKFVSGISPASINRVTNFTASCKEIDWAVWSFINGKAAAGSINSKGSPIAVTMSSGFDLESAPQIWRQEEFKRFKGNIPTGTVARTSWSKESGGKITVCFSQPVKEPVLLLASLGSYKDRILTTINFSEPYVVVYNDGGMISKNNSAITGREGYAIVKFPGEIKCITITSSTFEDFTDFSWGLPVCLEGIEKTKRKDAEPEPAPKPAAIAKTEPGPTTEAKSKPKVIEPEPKAKTVATVSQPDPFLASTSKIQTERIEPAPAPNSLPTLAKPEPVAASVPAPEPKGSQPIPAAKPVAPIPAVQSPLSSLSKSPKAPEPGLEATAAIVKPAAPAALIERSAPVAAANPVQTPLAQAPVSKTGDLSKVKARAADASSKPAVKKTPAVTPLEAISANRLKIDVYDYDGVDYDSVSLKFNNKQLGPASIQLQLSKRNGTQGSGFSVDLQPGSNTLEIYALSEGLRPFATVCLQISYPDRTKKLYFTLKAKESTTIEL